MYEISNQIRIEDQSTIMTFPIFQQKIHKLIPLPNNLPILVVTPDLFLVALRCALWILYPSNADEMNRTVSAFLCWPVRIWWCAFAMLPAKIFLNILDMARAEDLVVEFLWIFHLFVDFHLLVDLTDTVEGIHLHHCSLLMKNLECR